MDHHKLLFTILENTYTRKAALRRLRLLREYLERIFYSEDHDLTLSDFLKNQKVSPTDYKIMTSWDKSLYESITPENLYAIINNISKYIKELPKVTLYIPSTLNSSEIQKIGRWFRKNVSPNTLLDIQKDEEKIAGCAIVKNGVYSDYSLAYFIEKNKDSILGLVNEYATKEKTHN